MKRRFLSYTYIYIVSLLGLVAAACQSDLNGFWGGGESDGQSISVAVDIPEVRTRAIDMNAGAAVYLKNIWIGVYDKTDGTKVGGTEGIVDLRNYLAASGNTIVDLVSIKCNGLETGRGNENKYCVVGVANVGDETEGNKIETTSGGSLAAALKALKNNTTKWEDFIKIAIDTRGEYNPQAPVLAGYMEKEDATSIATNGYIKVDQTATNSGVNLTGYNADADADVYLSASSSTDINTQYTENRIEKNYVLKLRRMQSRINVSINEPDEKENNPAPNIVITNLAYKVYNNPGSAYLLQRRTNTFTTPDFNGKTDKAYSPNSADVIGKDGKFDYFDDKDWTTPPISTNFSFEHFENKHWAKNITDLKEYHGREKNDKNGVFSVLATDAADWNNNASYFVLKMNIRDENTGKNGEILYTIHEGFINDEEGRDMTNNLATRLQDFSCVRNTEYFYKITVKGINDIEVQVSKEGPHTNDQQGSLWRMNYMVTGKDKDENGNKIDVNYVISGDEGEFDVDEDNKAGITLLEPADGKYDNASVALRLVGSYYDADKRMEIPVDLCYNFKRGDLDGFAGLWPSPTNAWTEYIVATDGKTAYQAWQEFYNGGNGESENAKNLSQFISKVMVKMDGASNYITIDEYITKIHGKDDEEEEGRKVVDPTVNPNIVGYKVEGYKYYVAFDKDSDKKRDHLRGLYVFDKKKAFTGGERVWTDADEHSDADPCTYLYQINAMEQVPYYLETETHEMKYATGSKDTHVPYNANGQKYTGFSDGHNGTGMLLSAEPDFAFRLLGYDGDTKEYYDIWYNLGLFDYNDFFTNTATWNAWPGYDLNNTRSVIVQKGMLGEKTIPQSFLAGIKIVVNGSSDAYSLNDFIWQYESGKLKLTSTDKVGFEVNGYDKLDYVGSLENKRKNMRALYLLDRKNKYLVPAIYDEKTHEATYQAYAVEQYPNKGTATPLKLPTTGLPKDLTYNAENYLDPYINQIVKYGEPTPVRLPENSDYDPEDYTYRIIIKDPNPTANKEYSWEVDVKPVNGYFTFNIPMKASTGLGNGTYEIYVQAVALYDKYTDSQSQKIGTVKLDAPGATTATLPDRFQPIGGDNQAWKTRPTPAAIRNDWNFANNYWSNNLGSQLNHINPGGSLTLGNLTFRSPDNSSGRVINITGSDINFANSGCGLEFLIYKDCKMTITGNAAGDLNSCSIVDDSGSNEGKRSITSTIQLGNYMNQSISIQGNKVKITQITFAP